MSRIRKALAAAGSAGLAVLITGLQTEIPRTQAGWVALVAAAVGAAVVAGWAVWRIPNAPAVELPADGTVRRAL
jgi:hypothetical protein